MPGQNRTFLFCVDRASRARSANLGEVKRLGILSGSFNPPTVAHIGLLQAARPYVDELLCVVPAAFPHKDFFGATLEQRLQMVRLATSEQDCRVEPTSHGLFIDIARDLRERSGDRVELFFLCGADAAERVIGWDYGEVGFAERMLREFHLLVAPRKVAPGKIAFQPPPHLAHCVHPLSLQAFHQTISSTEVRERIAQSQTWEHLVPPQILEIVRQIYPANQPT